MKRTQIQLDEATYQMLRKRAFDQGISMAALLREILREHLSNGSVRRRHVEDFQFVASGRSEQSDLAPVSERHDEALASELSS